MKHCRLYISLILFVILMITSQSCHVMIKHDNGKHKGWNKKSNDHKQVFIGPGNSKIKFRK
jgi:hypothetical protein